MMNVKPLFLAMVLCFGDASAQSYPTILSDGEFANNEFVFAVGVPSISFKNINDCTGSAACRTSWKAADGSSLGTVTLSSGACVPPSTSFSCSFASPVLTTVYKTSDTSTAQNTSVSVELNFNSSLVSTRTYTIKYCDSSSDVIGDNVDISSLSSLEYLNTSEVPCEAGFQTSDVGNVTTVTCLSNATLNQAQSCIRITTTTRTTGASTTVTTPASTTVTTPASTTVTASGTSSITRTTAVSAGATTFDGNEVKCVNQHYNKKSSPAKEVNGTVVPDVMLYCVGFTDGYTAGITISVLGGLALIAAIAIYAIFVGGLELILSGLVVACAILWVIGIGLLFGLDIGARAMTGGQIAGCVIGSIATAGLLASCGYMVMNPKAKSSSNGGGHGNSGKAKGNDMNFSAVDGPQTHVKPGQNHYEDEPVGGTQDMGAHRQVSQNAGNSEF